jgi:hypothetical protein
MTTKIVNSAEHTDLSLLDSCKIETRLMVDIRRHDAPGAVSSCHTLEVPADVVRQFTRQVQRRTLRR